MKVEVRKTGNQSSTDRVDVCSVRVKPVLGSLSRFPV